MEPISPAVYFGFPNRNDGQGSSGDFDGPRRRPQGYESIEVCTVQSSTPPRAKFVTLKMPFHHGPFEVFPRHNLMAGGGSSGSVGR